MNKVQAEQILVKANAFKPSLPTEKKLKEEIENIQKRQTEILKRQELDQDLLKTLIQL